MDKIMEIFLSRSFFNCRHALLRREFITNKGISLVKLQKAPYSKNVGSTEKKKKTVFPHHYQSNSAHLPPCFSPDSQLLRQECPKE